MSAKGVECEGWQGQGCQARSHIQCDNREALTFLSLGMSCLRVTRATFPGEFRCQETEGRVLNQERTLNGSSQLLLNQPGFRFHCHHAAQSLRMLEQGRESAVSCVW